MSQASELIQEGLAQIQQGNPKTAVTLFSQVLDADEHSVFAYANRACAYSGLGEPHRALEDINQAIELAPNDFQLYFNRGHVHAQLGDTDQALIDYNQSINLNPKAIEAYFNRAITLEQQDPQQAIADLSTIIELQADHQAAYLKRGQLYCQQGQLQKASDDFAQILTLNPQSETAQSLLNEIISFYNEQLGQQPERVDYYVNRGEVFRKLKRLDAALSDWHYALKLNTDDPLLYSNLGGLCYEMGDNAQALEYFNQSLQLAADIATTYKHRALVLLRQHKTEEALADLNRAIELDPQQFDFWYLRGRLLRQQQQLEAALADLDHVIRLKADYAFAYDEHGYTLLALGRAEPALEDFLKALKYEPTADRYYRCGMLLAAQEQLLDALLYLTKALEAAPDYVEALTERGQIYYELARFDRALADFDAAIRMNPTYHIAWAYRANMHVRYQQWQQAINDASHAISLAPQYAYPYRLRAQAYQEKHLFKKAIEDLNQFLKLEPENEAVQQQLAQLTPQHNGGWRWLPNWFKR